MSTIHWTWKAYDPKTKTLVGKNHVYNNFCVSPISNEQFCTVCHVGYGSTDPNKFVPFDHRSQDHVDCLVCHDQTKTYHKIPFIGGNPAMEKIAVRPGCGEVYGTDKPFVEPENLANIAQHRGLAHALHLRPVPLLRRRRRRREARRHGQLAGQPRAR
jgi:hypothetical protein